MGKRGHRAQGKKLLGPDLGSSCSYSRVESFRGRPVLRGSVTAQSLSHSAAVSRGRSLVGDGGPRVQPLSYPPADTELELGEAGKGSGELLPNLFFGGRPPSPAGSGVGPLPGRETSHISHLIPQLCIFRLSFLFLVVVLLRGHVRFISLCQAFGAGTDKQIVLPENLVAAVAATLPLTAV